MALKRKLTPLGSTLYTLTWKQWTTPLGVSRSRLRGSALRTSETASTGSQTGWPTPAAQEAGGTPEQFLARKEKARANGSQLGISLTSLSLMAQLSGWVTPTCQSPNSLRGQGQDPMKRKEQGHTINLTDAANFVRETPQPARLTASGELLIGSSAGMESGGQLNPAHSRWLMGYPPEWDACAATAMPLTSRQRKRLSNAILKDEPPATQP